MCLRCSGWSSPASRDCSCVQPLTHHHSHCGCLHPPNHTHAHTSGLPAPTPASTQRLSLMPGPSTPAPTGWTTSPSTPSGCLSGGALGACVRVLLFLLVVPPWNNRCHLGVCGVVGRGCGVEGARTCVHGVSSGRNSCKMPSVAQRLQPARVAAGAHPCPQVQAPFALPPPHVTRCPWPCHASHSYS
jgi:hypothetical protein